MYNVNEDKLNIELDNDKLALILNAKTSQFEFFIPRDYIEMQVIFTAIAWLFSDTDIAKKTMEMVLLSFASESLNGATGIKVTEQENIYEKVPKGSLVDQLFKDLESKK